MLTAFLLVATLLPAPRLARADSGDTFLETLGIGIAVGTVLGASTLPFTDQPGKNLVNVAYGAGAGAIVALGVAVYGWLGPSRGGDQASASLFAQTNLFAQAKDLKPSRSQQQLRLAVNTPQHQPPRALVWTPIVSLTW